MENEPSKDRLIERFEEGLRRLHVPGEARGILIAASGGPDSTALCRLFALARDRSPPGAAWPPLWLGHVHHGIRGADADADAEFARELAGALRFRDLEARLDAPALAREKGLSPEAAARAARYSAFSSWTARHPIDVVALAHTADDQAETVLLRILRKAGLRGLGGMPEERPLSSGMPGPFPRLVRPILGWRRAEVLSLLAEMGQPFREDPTNRSPSILRNRIRHVLLPLLRSDYQPAIGEALLEIARIAGEAARDLEGIARKAIEGAAVRRSQERLTIDGEVLRELPPGARAFALRALAADYLRERGEDPSGAPSLRRLEGLPGWFSGETTESRSMDLGTGLRAELRRGDFILSRAGPPCVPPPPAALPLPGLARWRDWEIRSEILGPEALPSSEARRSSPIQSVELVDRASLSGPLEVRSRRPGDRLQPLGAPGSKKLKEFLRERGVPEGMRDGVPLVVDSCRIVWVVGHRIADPCKLGPGSREAVKLTARPAGDCRPAAGEGS